MESLSEFQLITLNQVLSLKYFKVIVLKLYRQYINANITQHGQGLQ